MEKKEEYNIECGVCGTEFYILDKKCPNCRAENQSHLFSYLSSKDTFKRIKIILAAVYSLPGLIPSFLLFLYGFFLYLGAAIGVFFGSIATVIDLGGYIFTGEHLLNFSDYHQPVSSITGFQNHFLLSFTIIIFSIFILLLIHGVGFFTEKKLGLDILEAEDFGLLLISIAIPYSHFKFRLNRQKRRVLYLAAQEVVDMEISPNVFFETEEKNIYKLFSYKIAGKISPLRKGVRHLSKMRKESLSGAFNHDIKINYESLNDPDEWYISFHQKKYILSKGSDYLAKQQERLNDPDRIIWFLIDLPEEDAAEYGILLDSTLLFLISNIIAITLWSLLIDDFFNLHLFY